MDGIDDGAKLKQAMAGIEVVIHLAAAQHEAEQPETYFQKINVDGSLAVLHASREAGARRLVYGSTIGVYGQGAPSRLDETSKPRPDNGYGRSKLEAEEALLAEAAPPERVICLIGEAYGPGDGRLIKIFKAFKNGMPCRVGKGANLHQPIYVEDLIQGLLAAASRPGIDGERFLLAGPAAVDSRAMIVEIAAEPCQRSLDHPSRARRPWIRSLKGTQPAGRGGVWEEPRSPRPGPSA